MGISWWQMVSSKGKLMKNIIIAILFVALLIVCTWCLHDTARERQEIASLRGEVKALLSMKPELDSIVEQNHRRMQKEWFSELSRRIEE